MAFRVPTAEHAKEIIFSIDVLKESWGLYNLYKEQIKKYNRKHKTKLEAADDGKTYLPKGSYTLLWNDSKISMLTIE